MPSLFNFVSGQLHFILTLKLLALLHLVCALLGCLYLLLKTPHCLSATSVLSKSLTWSKEAYQKSQESVPAQLWQFKNQKKIQIYIRRFIIFLLLKRKSICFKSSVVGFLYLEVVFRYYEASEVPQFIWTASTHVAQLMGILHHT